jgi:hypothetical protein
LIKDDQTSHVVPPDVQTNRQTVSDADLEQMYNLLYAYRFGSISFLELLDMFEDILHIGTPQNGPPD